jgi:hypothetical protein
MPSRLHGLPDTAQLRLRSDTVTRKPMQSKEPSEISQVGTELGTAQNCPQVKETASRPSCSIDRADYK